LDFYKGGEDMDQRRFDDRFLLLILAIGFIVGVALLGIGIAKAGTLNLGAGKRPIQVFSMSDELTETGQAVTGTCAFKSVIVKTDGTNNVTISVYAGTDNSGNRLIPYQTVIPGDSRIFMIEFGVPQPAVGGVYVEISTAGAARVQVQYDQG
jgi:hypothetical protein